MKTAGCSSLPVHVCTIYIEQYAEYQCFSNTSPLNCEASIRYRSFRLIDLRRIYRMMPLTMEDFLKETTRCAAERARYLADHWIKECSDTAEEYYHEIEYIVDNQAGEVL